MSLEISGEQLHGIENESGGHRIQRVPPTEKRGRVHTSTVTVAVLQKSKKNRVTVVIDDCEIEWFSGRGAGGQHRNKHQNCCRLRHKATGLTESAQCRTRQQSLSQALLGINQKVNAVLDTNFDKQRRSQTQTMIGTGQRADKIRTIQFQNDLAVDHRTGKKISAVQYMRGGMNQLW